MDTLTLREYPKGRIGSMTLGVDVIGQSFPNLTIDQRIALLASLARSDTDTLSVGEQFTRLVQIVEGLSETLLARAHAIHDYVHEHIRDASTIIYAHEGIFVENSEVLPTTHEMTFVVLSTLNLPQAVGIATTNWQTGDVSVSLDNRLANYSTLLADLGLTAEATG